MERTELCWESRSANIAEKGQVEVIRLVEMKKCTVTERDEHASIHDKVVPL